MNFPPVPVNYEADGDVKTTLTNTFEVEQGYTIFMHVYLYVITSSAEGFTFLVLQYISVHFNTSFLLKQFYNSTLIRWYSSASFLNSSELSVLGDPSVPKTFMPEYSNDGTGPGMQFLGLTP